MLIIIKMLVVKKTHLVNSSRYPTACYVIYMDYFIFIYNRNHEIGNCDYLYWGKKLRNAKWFVYDYIAGECESQDKNIQICLTIKLKFFATTSSGSSKLFLN